ncbi:MAG: phosphoserine phosphatase SerB [Cycloclasticus sp.]|nr:phosphoserine phosphatase SerB [Cycloclasticus sp.]MBG96781.1 phosphoserine phosphatase SerB [Cycloclasticus sp.]HAI96673.1 phosphoserine phosphatase SerB [Methylococcaceae bacterium]
MNKYIFHKDILSDDEQSFIKASFKALAEKEDSFYCLKTSKLIDLSAVREQLQCDVSVLKNSFDGQQFRLLVTDMDSTLISIECIDEIADMLGIKPEVSRITEAAMRGELNFEESLTQRVALLKGLPVGELQRVYDERLRLNPGAEKLIDYLKQKGIKLALVSGGFTFFTDKLKQRLGIDYTLANTLDVEGGCLTGRVEGDIVGAQAKADLLIELSKTLEIETQQVIAMGDGANDLRMMDCAGLSVAYHAKPTVQAQTDIQINHRGLDAVIDVLKASSK